MISGSLCGVEITLLNCVSQMRMCRTCYNLTRKEQSHTREKILLSKKSTETEKATDEQSNFEKYSNKVSKIIADETKKQSLLLESLIVNNSKIQFENEDKGLKNKVKKLENENNKLKNENNELKNENNELKDNINIIVQTLSNK